jgi:hypothetical protein
LNKGTERLIVFIFGVVFTIAILGLAILFPEPKPFQYNVFKTVLALACAGIAAFIPGFIQVTINTYIRAGGAIAVFVIIFFNNPAELVTNYKQVQKKYDLIAFQLGQHISAVDFVINDVTVGNSDTIAAIRKNAYEQLDTYQSEADQLDLKINLKKLFETVNSNNNVFPQKKQDYIIDALTEIYDQNTVNYFRTGWYLAWVFVKGSLAFNPEAVNAHPEYSRQFIEIYPNVANRLNKILKQFGYSNQLPEQFSNINDLQQKALAIKGEILDRLNHPK